MELARLAKSREQVEDALLVWDQARIPQQLKVISKFEQLRFIHIFRSASSDRLKVVLPRLQLEVEVLPNGRFSSTDWAGYELSPKQHFDDGTLKAFKSYLLLTPGEAMRSAEGGPVKLVVPAGIVQRSSSGAVEVQLDSSSGAELRYRSYDIHPRFGDLRAHSVEDRLQLAALHAATSCSLPAEGTGMTGVEAAMECLRRCFVDRPLSRAEAEHLRSLQQHAGGAAGLYLLAVHLQQTSDQLAFLQPTGNDTDKEQPAGPKVEEVCDYKTAYMCEVRLGRCSDRLRLTRAEEERLLGLPRGLVPPPFTPTPSLAFIPE